MKALEQKLAAANSQPARKESAPEKTANASARPKRSAANVRQTVERTKAEKVHIGAWLHKDFKRGLMLLRAETGEDLQTVLARVLNTEFRAHKLPVVKG